MRLAMLTLLAAGMLAACQPAKPSSAQPTEELPPEVLANMAGVAERGPEMEFKPMPPPSPESEQARQQAEASFRDLDRSAAAIGPEISGMRRQADEAYRRARPPEPALPRPAATPPAAPAASVPPPPAPSPPMPPTTPAPTPGG